MCVVARRIPQTQTHGEQTMTNDGQTTNDAILRDAFRKMDPYQAQEIRDAYYKAIEGLHTLAEMLEIADAQQDTTTGPLLTEHFLAVEAMEAMKRSRLGAIL
jgi:hypothetical protein